MRFPVNALCRLDRLNLTLFLRLKILPDLPQKVLVFANKRKLLETRTEKGDLTHLLTLLKAIG